MPLTLSRSILVILVPGIVAIAPWCLLAIMRIPAATDIYQTYQTAVNAVLFALAVVFGSCLESIGSRREVRWDQQQEQRYNVREAWFTYLAESSPVEPVGNRYIARTVTTMYFELAMSLAAPIMFLGIATNFLLEQSPSGWILGTSLSVAVAISGYYFHRSARDTHRVLCEARLELMVRRLRGH